MLFTFENKSSARTLRVANGMAFFISIDEYFNKTEADIFLLQILLP